MKIKKLEQPLDTPLFDLQPDVVYFYLENPETDTYFGFSFDSRIVIGFRISTTDVQRYSQGRIIYASIKKERLPLDVPIKRLLTLFQSLQDLQNDKQICEHWDYHIYKTSDTSVPMLFDYIYGKKMKPTVRIAKKMNSNYVLLALALDALKEAELYCPEAREMMDVIEQLPYVEALKALKQYVTFIDDETGEEVQ